MLRQILYFLDYIILYQHTIFLYIDVFNVKIMCTPHFDAFSGKTLNDARAPLRIAFEQI